MRIPSRVTRTLHTKYAVKITMQVVFIMATNTTSIKKQENVAHVILTGNVTGLDIPAMSASAIIWLAVATTAPRIIFADN